MTLALNCECQRGICSRPGGCPCCFREATMRKVTVQLEMHLLTLVDEGVEISDVVSELDYELRDTTTTADILDTEITGYEVIDSK